MQRMLRGVRALIFLGVTAAVLAGFTGCSAIMFRRAKMWSTNAVIISTSEGALYALSVLWRDAWPLYAFVIVQIAIATFFLTAPKRSRD